MAISQFSKITLEKAACDKDASFGNFITIIMSMFGSR